MIAGDFVPDSYYPEAFRGTLLFNDLGQGIVRAIRFGANGEVQSVIPFSSGANAVVQIVAGLMGDCITSIWMMVWWTLDGRLSVHVSRPWEDMFS